MKGDRCQRHDEPFARLGVAVRYKPFSFGDINVLPLGAGKLTNSCAG